MNNSKTQVVKDLKAKSILVSREFNASVDLVWRAYTEKELLDQWWAPAPWHAETKHMNFSVGGYWLYAMVGPENEKHWGRMNYLAIDHQKSFDLEDAFCDADGNMNSKLLVSKGRNSFTATANGTRVEFKMTYPKEADVEKLIEMGFEQGIIQAMDQLEKLFAKMK